MASFPLTVSPPQGVSYAAPLLDFSPIGGLMDKYAQGVKQKSDYDTMQVLKQGLPTDADGNIDYAKAAQTLAQTGNLGAVSQLAQIGALTTKTLPPGYRRSANGGYEAIPGGPADPEVIAATAAAGQKPQFTQIGEDIYGNKQYGFVDPTTKKVTPAAGGSVGAPSSSSPPPVGADGQPLTGDDYLKTLPPGMAQRIKAITEGRGGPPPSGAALRSPQVAMLMDKIAQYEPGFDLTAWSQRVAGMKDFYGGGKSAEMVKSTNQTISHVGDMVASMMGLNNTSIPGINYVKNAYNTATGSPQVTEFIPNAHAVAEELSKVFKGANLSDAEIHAWEQSLSPNMSPEQQKAAVGKLMSLLNGSLGALEEKRRQSLGEPMADKKGPLLTPEAQKTLENVNKWVSGDPSVNAAMFRHPFVKPKNGAAPAQGGQAAAGGGTSAKPQAAGDPLSDARAAIARGADRNAVIERLKQNGIDPSGL